MEFWGVEVQAGKSLKVKPEFESVIHVSQASLDKGKKGETAFLYVTVDGKKLVIGTLSQGNIPQISFDLVFEKEFELSHSLESGSVHFVGYKSPNMVEDEDFSELEDDEEEEEAAVPVPAAVTANGSNVVKADSKPKAAKPVEVKPESDEDDDESDEEDDSEEDGSDSEQGMDVDEDDSDDEEEDDSEDEETPKKPEVSNKKRPNESASKTPISAKKAKPAEEKKGGHTATPHPAKKGGKSPMNANQSPKSGGGSNKKQFNSGKQFGSNNKGKGKGKGRA
ncbi:unnamed protein product [Eruca vesicaria subsp. sativa]|uniref:Nucleoplasmin-like domain-containing protein n=1 Tax=Eruca vesicaria subsp. sativa TaxID=29727 RepID=A0ABC8KEV9_ERUVS|nr:unnamed protein product [Eruca vesicaria subsp. sativa]